MSTHNRMIVVLSFAVLLTTQALIVPAQFSKDRSRQSKSVAEKTRSLRSMSVELRQHTALLQRALVRYLASSDSLTPYLTSHQFWLELRSSRMGSRGTSIRRSRREVLVLWQAYRDLEKDIERMMLDDQLALFADGLSLNDVQYERIDAVLRKDAEEKFKLLSASGTTDRSFLHRLTRISAESEAQIRKVLFPEQLQIYEKRQTELKMIWTA